MKKFKNDEDFDIDPTLFHTDLKFLDCEYFLSDHVDHRSPIKYTKPPLIKKRTSSLEIKNHRD